MTSNVEGLDYLKRFHFKRMERLNFKLSLTVLHSLINDYKEQKMCKPWKTKKNPPMIDRWIDGWMDGWMDG